MTTTTRRLDTGMPGLYPAPTVRSRVTGAVGTRPSIVKPIALDRDNLLRILNGRGTRIHVASGVLWVTEENNPDDHVLLPGDTIDLTKKGTAIVLAHRPARVVIEVPYRRGTPAPGRDGAGGRGARSAHRARGFDADIAGDDCDGIRNRHRQRARVDSNDGH